MREILSLSSSDYDYERLSRKHRIFSVLDKETQDPVFTWSGDYAYKVWLLLSYQKKADYLMLPDGFEEYQSRYLEFCGNSNCFGTACFMEGGYNIQKRKNHFRRNSDQGVFSINGFHLNSFLKFLRSDEERFLLKGRNTVFLKDVENPSTVLFQSLIGYFHATTFLCHLEDDSIFFDKQGYDLEEPFRIVSRSNIFDSSDFSEPPPDIMDISLSVKGLK